MNPGGPVEIRRATAADLQVLADVFRRASLANDGDRDVLLAHPEALEIDPGPLARGLVRAAVLDGRVVGFASTDRGGDAATAELVDLFVAPEAMRHGIGRALVEDAATRARADGDAAITVDANDHALAFYRSVGFEVIGSSPTRFGTTPRMRREL